MCCLFPQACRIPLPRWWWMDRASATPQTPSKAHWTLNGISTMTCESGQTSIIYLLFIFFYQILRLVCSYIGKTDSITISIWNHKKIHKRQGAGFLGCIRLLSNAISRLKDTGCKSDFVSASDPKWIKEYLFMDFPLSPSSRPASRSV